MFIEEELDIDDILYMSPAGPISTHDVLYGWDEEIRRTNQDFYSHKMGFTSDLMMRTLYKHGFKNIVVTEKKETLEIEAYAYKCGLQSPRMDGGSLSK